MFKNKNISLITTFLKTNLITLSILVSIGIVVLVSFMVVKEQSVDSVRHNMDNVIENAQLTRDLSEVFIEIEFISDFHKSNEHVVLTNIEVTKTLEDIANNTSNTELKNVLYTLIDDLHEFVNFHSKIHHTLLHSIISYSSRIEKEITKIERNIKDKLIHEVLDDDDILFLNNQLSQIIGCQQELLLMDKYFAEYKDSYNYYADITKSKLMTTIDSFLLRLKTMTASTPEVVTFSQTTHVLTERYKNLIITFHKSLNELVGKIDELSSTKNDALDITRNIESEFANATRLAISNIEEPILKYLFILFFSIFVIILASFLYNRRVIHKNIQTPMEPILTAINSYNNGQFKHNINNINIREWDTIYNALNLMSTNLDNANQKLIRTNQELEERVKDRTLELTREKELIQVTLHSIGDAVITTDGNSIIDFMNPIAEKLTGYTNEEAKGEELSNIFNIINEESRLKVINPVYKCLAEGKIIGLANHTILINKNGTEYAIQDSAAPIKDEDGKTYGVILVFSDVTESRKISRQMSYDATHDMLTGLINRQEFERRLKRVIDTAKDDNSINALFYLDLDQFKLVNDTCGHFAGDELLRQVSHLIQDHIRFRDSVARLGGDEFAILIERCSLKKAKNIANTLINIVTNYKFTWEEKQFKVGVSIGLVEIDNMSIDNNSVLSAADMACYMAKEQGRGRVHVYKIDDEDYAQKRGEMQWAIRLPRALDSNLFHLYFQTIIPAKGINGEHYEILIRLKENDKVIAPKTFFPAADRYNLSNRIDKWVINNLFHWLSNNINHMKNLYLCSVNLSGHSLNDGKFLEFLYHQFKKYNIPPEKICFEITETVAISNLSRASEFINKMKVLGCSFSLDDFGSGLSSFAYLKNLPIDFLKIDGLFVKDIETDPLDLAMVKSIIEMAHVLDIKTVAEYVENDVIKDKLIEINVDYMQGFGIQKPSPINELNTKLNLLKTTKINKEVK